MSYYFCAGLYEMSKGVKEFRLVRPSPKSPGAKSFPYITQHAKNRLFVSCKHHSHLYRLDGTSAILVQESFEASCGIYSVKAPTEVQLTEEQVNEIMIAAQTDNVWELDWDYPDREVL